MNVRLLAPIALLSAAVCMHGQDCSAAQVVVGSTGLKVTLDLGDHGVRETAISVGNSSLGITGGIPWTAEVDGVMLSPQGSARLVSSDPRKAVFSGSGDGLDWVLTYEVTGPTRITKSLVFTSKKDLTVQRVSMWAAESETAPLVAKTDLQDIAAFYRHGKRGLFASLDFPYSKITRVGDATKVSYPPFEKLKAGDTYSCHSLTVGATSLTGKERYGFYDGEVDAMDSYVQERVPPRFNKPMLVTCGMNNRYCQPEGGHIWYTMADHGTLSFNADTLKTEISLTRKLGMEYFQLFPGEFDWVPGDPDPKLVKDVMDFSRSVGMHTGDYSTVSGLFCVHYNEYNKTLSKPEWRVKDENGNATGVFNLGSKDFVDFYSKNVAATCRKYGFEFHNLDSLCILPDRAKDTGYPPGDDSIYQQVKGLVRLIDTIDQVSPEMMTWSNAGNWEQFLPKLAWWNHNLYLTDPFIASPWQGLNMTRLLDDARREQMVSLHHSRFIPYRSLTNYQYFFAQNSIVPDIRNYQYGALSTLAVTPNLGLGDIRPWMDKLPDREVARIEAFYQRWIGFIKKNYGLWTKTYSAGGNPGMGTVEIYGHAKGDHGFVFIVNPQYWDRTVDVPLDAALGFSGRGKCEIAELYPTERLRLTAQGPFPSLGSTIPIHVPAQQVLIMEVRPAPKTVTEPRLYGLPGSLERTSQGYLLKTNGPQGHAERCAVLLPQGWPGIASVSVRPDVPKQPKRLWADTPVKLLASKDSSALVELTFRRTPAPTELRDWQVTPGSLTEGVSAGWVAGLKGGESLSFPLFVNAEGIDPMLPVWEPRATKLGLGPLAGFCGAYIDHAFSEDQETWVDLKSGDSHPQPGEIVSAEVPPTTRPLSPLAKDSRTGWWLESKFNLPFMYSQGGFEPFFDDHTMLVLPMVRQAQVSEIHAWINGVPLDVRTYRYTRNQSLACYWADLLDTGAHAGDNTIVVHFETAR